MDIVLFQSKGTDHLISPEGKNSTQL